MNRHITAIRRAALPAPPRRAEQAKAETSSAQKGASSAGNTPKTRCSATGYSLGGTIAGRDYLSGA